MTREMIWVAVTALVIVYGILVHETAWLLVPLVLVEGLSHISDIRLSESRRTLLDQVMRGWREGRWFHD
jgi:hypothetical protein